MNHKTPDLRRVRALLALRQLSSTLASDALADGTIASRFGFSLIRPTRLSDDLVARSETLFNAFRAAADGSTIPPILDENDTPVNAKVRIDKDGAGIIEADGKGWRFPNAGLLSSDPKSRMAALDAALSGNTINTRDAAALRTLVAKAQFSNDDFVQVIGVLTSSLKSFSATLRSKISTGRVGEDDLLPNDVRHWDHLTAPIDKSMSLSHFIANELADERRARLANDPVRGFASIALTFAAPALVARAFLASFDADRVLKMIEQVTAIRRSLRAGGKLRNLRRSRGERILVLLLWGINFLTVYWKTSKGSRMRAAFSLRPSFSRLHAWRRMRSWAGGRSFGGGLPPQVMHLSSFEHVACRMLATRNCCRGRREFQVRNTCCPSIAICR